jgi:hypothetical protein
MLLSLVYFVSRRLLHAVGPSDRSVKGSKSWLSRTDTVFPRRSRRSSAAGHPIARSRRGGSSPRRAQTSSEGSPLDGS